MGLNIWVFAVVEGGCEDGCDCKGRALATSGVMGEYGGAVGDGCASGDVVFVAAGEADISKGCDISRFAEKEGEVKIHRGRSC